MTIKFCNYCGGLSEVEVEKSWLDTLRKHYYEPDFRKLNIEMGLTTFQRYVRAVLKFKCR